MANAETAITPIATRFAADFTKALLVFSLALSIALVFALVSALEFRLRAEIESFMPDLK